MGRTRKMLAMGGIAPRVITPDGIWSDLCENVHLHYRNTRFDFSEKEWAHFRAAINHLGRGVEHEAADKEYREGNPNFLVQIAFNVPVKSDSEYYPNRVLIELQHDNTVHFHYRDLRLHFTFDEFKAIAGMFAGALEQLNNLKPFMFAKITEPIWTVVPIDEVQPYDDGHRALAMDDEHREGIEFVKSLIQDGERIRPILVAPDGRRLDGFKRYMAQKELGFTEIEVIIDPFGEMGGQGNMSLTIDEGDMFFERYGISPETKAINQ